MKRNQELARLGMPGVVDPKERLIIKWSNGR
jgi:hypothetical protein